MFLGSSQEEGDGDPCSFEWIRYTTISGFNVFLITFTVCPKKFPLFENLEMVNLSMKLSLLVNNC